MTIIKFTETKLTNLGKRGDFKPDADGYYTHVIGGLNIMNSAGEIYVAEGARNLFEGSSSFMRRVKAGYLKGELGHPKRQQGMTDRQYLERIMTIEETNVCVHFADIYLDTEFGRKNPHLKEPQMIGIIAKLTPSGPHAHVLKASLENRLENLSFSIRALTRDNFIRGRNYRELVQIFTWDSPTEPGIAPSNKWDSPALETLHEMPVTRDQLRMIAEENNSMLSLESNMLAKETYHIVDLIGKPLSSPLFSKW